MKTIKIFPMLAMIVVIAIFSACSSTDEEVEPDAELKDMKVFAEGAIPGTDLSVKIYQYTDSLIVGYNRFEILVTKTGFEGAFTNAEITFKPMMDMGTMMHACPIENPVAGVNYDKIFAGAIVFIMPSGDMGSWMLTIQVKDTETDEEGQIELPVIVTMPDEARMKSFAIGDDKYFVSLVEPVAPQVGINDFEVTVHKKLNMMEWPAASSFNISIEPEMPDMGHGSPNNVDPVHTSVGHYKGNVNFTMDGYWKINMDLETGGQSTALSFDITF